MDVPVVSPERHYSTIPKHKCASIQSTNVCTYICVRRYVHLKYIVCKDAVGQTPEKRHLGRESSGALVCISKSNSIQMAEYKTMHYYTCVTLRPRNEW